MSAHHVNQLSPCPVGLCHCHVQFGLAVAALLSLAIMPKPRPLIVVACCCCCCLLANVIVCRRCCCPVAVVVGHWSGCPVHAWFGRMGNRDVCCAIDVYKHHAPGWRLVVMRLFSSVRATSLPRCHYVIFHCCLARHCPAARLRHYHAHASAPLSYYACHCCLLMPGVINMPAVTRLSAWFTPLFVVYVTIVHLSSPIGSWLVMLSLRLASTPLVIICHFSCPAFAHAIFGFIGFSSAGWSIVLRFATCRCHLLVNAPRHFNAAIGLIVAMPPPLVGSLSTLLTVVWSSAFIVISTGVHAGRPPPRLVIRMPAHYHLPVIHYCHYHCRLSSRHAILVIIVIARHRRHYTPRHYHYAHYHYVASYFSGGVYATRVHLVVSLLSTSLHLPAVIVTVTKSGSINVIRSGSRPRHYHSYSLLSSVGSRYAAINSLGHWVRLLGHQFAWSAGWGLGRSSLSGQLSLVDATPGSALANWFCRHSPRPPLASRSVIGTACHRSFIFVTINIVYAISSRHPGLNG